MNQNCYNCKHRQNVPGSAHSSCGIIPNKETQVELAVLIIKMIRSGIQPEKIKFNLHGINNGWCLWPVDFDPCWVSDCKLWESKDVK